MSKVTIVFSEGWSWEPPAFVNLEDQIGSLVENPEFQYYMSERRIEMEDLTLEEAISLFQAL